MSKYIVLFSSVIFLNIYAINPVLSDNKYALIIGNGDYQFVTKLKNPKNDATDIANTLRKLKFKTQLIINASKKDIDTAVHEFINKISSTKSIGLFYYAGHASQIEGNNYIIPVNITANSETELKNRSYDLSSLLNKMKLAKNKQNIIVLDACRNNPFTSKFKKGERSISNQRSMARITKSQSSGLSKLDAPPNTLIAYASAPGKVALDGYGRNSPYTTALIKSIQMEGLTVEQIFKEVRVKLINETDGKQIPWESSSLVTTFYFKPRRILPTGW